MRRQREFLVVPAAHVETVVQAEKGVILVLHIHHIRVANGCCLDIFFIIQPLGLHGCGGHGGNLFQERGLRFPVHFHRGDSRFFHFLGVFIFSFAFINDHIVIPEIFIGVVNDLFLGNGAHIIYVGHIVGPVLAAAFDETVHQRGSAVVVVFQSLQFAQLGIVNDGFYEGFVKFSFLQDIKLSQQEGLYFFQRLALLGFTAQGEDGVIFQPHHACIGIEHLLLFVDIKVEQAGFAILQDR